MQVTITLEICEHLKEGDRVSHRKTGSMGTVVPDIDLSGRGAVVKWDNMDDSSPLRTTLMRNLIRHITVSG